MKKLLLIAFAAVTTFSASAQTEKGKYLLGGTASFDTEKYGSSSNKSTNITINPEVGYFFMDNLAGGLRLGLSSEKYKGSDYTETYSTTEVAPFLRYYFLSLAEKVKLFADVAYGFGTEKEKYKEDGEDTEEDKYPYGSFSVSAGPAFFLSPNAALMVALRYNNMKYKDASDAYSKFGVHVGFQLHFDFSKK